MAKPQLLYSHRRGYRSLAFLLVGLVSVGAYAVVSHLPDSSVPGWVLRARRAAVQTALRGQDAIRDARTARKLPINRGDQFRTGLIGVSSSRVTTELGSIGSHRTATDPVFAAAVVQMLYEAGVRRGDLVAVGETGSYPGFDLDVAAAIEAIGATPVTVSTLGSSAFGANEPGLTWLDMKKALVDAGVLHHRSVAVGPGGSLAGKDFAVRLRMAQASGLRVLPVLPPGESVRYLDRLYVRAANRLGRPIKAFVDVGGSTAMIGTSGAETIVKPGLSRPRWTPYQAGRLAVVGRMALRGIPIVALLNVGALAKLFGVPFDPHLPPSARDIAAPPPSPVALVIALVVLIGLVVGMHRGGMFRVPRWEVPAALQRASRRPRASREPEPDEPPSAGAGAAASGNGSAGSPPGPRSGARSAHQVLSESEGRS